MTPSQSRLFQSCLHTSTPVKQTIRDMRPSGAPMQSTVDTTSELVTQTLGNLFFQQSREEIQAFLYVSCIRHVNKSGCHPPTLSGHCQSVAIEWFHTANWSLRVRLFGMSEGGWQGYTYSLAADLWLKEGKSRGQRTLNSSV